MFPHLDIVTVHESSISDREKEKGRELEEGEGQRGKEKREGKTYQRDKMRKLLGRRSRKES